MRPVSKPFFCGAPSKKTLPLLLSGNPNRTQPAESRGRAALRETHEDRRAVQPTPGVSDIVGPLAHLQPAPGPAQSTCCQPQAMISGWEKRKKWDIDPRTKKQMPPGKKKKVTRFFFRPKTHPGGSEVEEKRRKHPTEAGPPRDQPTCQDKRSKK